MSKARRAPPDVGPVLHRMHERLKDFDEILKKIDKASVHPRTPPWLRKIREKLKTARADLASAHGALEHINRLDPFPTAVFAALADLREIVELRSDAWRGIEWHHRTPKRRGPKGYPEHVMVCAAGAMCELVGRGFSEARAAEEVARSLHLMERDDIAELTADSLLRWARERPDWLALLRAAQKYAVNSRAT